MFIIIIPTYKYYNNIIYLIVEIYILVICLLYFIHYNILMN